MTQSCKIYAIRIHASPRDRATPKYPVTTYPNYLSHAGLPRFLLVQRGMSIDLKEKCIYRLAVKGESIKDPTHGEASIFIYGEHIKGNIAMEQRRQRLLIMDFLLLKQLLISEIINGRREKQHHRALIRLGKEGFAGWMMQNVEAGEQPLDEERDETMFM